MKKWNRAAIVLVGASLLFGACEEAPDTAAAPSADVLEKTAATPDAVVEETPDSPAPPEVVAAEVPPESAPWPGPQPAPAGPAEQAAPAPSAWPQLKNTPGMRVQPLRTPKPLTPAEQAAVRKKTADIIEMAREYGDYNLGRKPGNRLANGGFESEWDAKGYPEGWGPVDGPLKPSCVRMEPKPDSKEVPSMEGTHHMMLTGQRDGEASLEALDIPPIEELRGKTVVFGAFLNCPGPKDVAVRITDGTRTLAESSPVARQNWQLVLVKCEIATDAPAVHCMVTLKKSRPAMTSLVDGAAFVVLE